MLMQDFFVLRGSLIYSLGPNPVSNSSLEGPPLISILCAFTLWTRQGFVSAAHGISSFQEKGWDPGQLQLDASYVELKEIATD